MCPPLLAAIPAAIGAVGSAVGSIGLGTVATLAGTGLSAYGAIQQGNAQKAAADAQADALNKQAVATSQQGQYEIQRKQEQNNGVMGNFIAGSASSGVDLSSGSTADVASTIASNGQLDMDTIGNNYKGKADNLVYQARASRQAGKDAQKAGFINAFSGVFNTMTQLGNPFGGSPARKTDADITHYGTAYLY